MLGALIWLLDTVIGLITLVLIVNAIVSWLIAFDVLNIRNDAIYRIVRALDAMTEPLLRPIRRFVPNLGGIDISPIILIIGLMFIQRLIHGLVRDVSVGLL